MKKKNLYWLVESALMIAVAIVLEHGASSRTCSTVAREMFDAYFFSKEVTIDTTKPGENLG